MQHDDDGGERSAETTSGNTTPRVSRRSLLKAMGLTAVGAAGGTRAVPAPFQIAATAQKRPPWVVAATSLPLQYALEQLKAYGFAFELEETNFREVAALADRVGLVLAATRTPSLRAGAEVLCTVDTANERVDAVQYVIGLCFDADIHVYGVVADEATALGDYMYGRVDQVPYNPLRDYRFWTFPKPPPEVPAEEQELPLEGWPADKVGDAFWWYGGSSAYSWTREGTPLLQSDAVTIYRSSRPEEVQTLVLDYTRKPQAEATDAA